MKYIAAIINRTYGLGVKKNVEKSGRPKKPPKQNLGKNQLLKLTEEYPDITVEELAAKLRSTPDIVRRYLHKFEI